MVHDTIPVVPRLAGKVAFITGIARGQGSSHAVRLAAEGADIIGVDLPAQDGDAASVFAQVVQDVTALGRRIVVHHADVRSLEQLTGALDDAVATLGRLDIVVANAGVVRTGRLLDLTEEDWRLCLDVNALGVMLTCKAAIPHMLRGGRGGSVVIVNSILGLKAAPNTASYTASKHASTGLMRTLALELAPEQIRVNSVHPTNVDTPMLRNEMPDGMTWEAFAAVVGRYNALPVDYVMPEDVSNAVAFLASDEARYITGATIPVDAGALITIPQ